MTRYRSRFVLISIAALMPMAHVLSASPPSDVDSFMRQVVEHRDDNWKHVRQFRFDEIETFDARTRAGRKIWGFTRESALSPSKDGTIARTPLRVDGVELSEAERRTAAQESTGRGKTDDQRGRHAEIEFGTSGLTTNPELFADVVINDQTVLEAIQRTFRPGFIDTAYLMNFTFDQGTYAFAGHEKMMGRDVYRVEYYPRQFFSRQDLQPTRQPGVASWMEAKMDKSSVVTFWIDPSRYQILQYEFASRDFGFMPGRMYARLDDVRLSMRMREASPGIWLPDAMDVRAAMTIAAGEVDARYQVRYQHYRQVNAPIH